jgi:hypothetical protein
MDGPSHNGGPPLDNGGGYPVYEAYGAGEMLDGEGSEFPMGGWHERIAQEGGEEFGTEFEQQFGHGTTEQFPEQGTTQFGQHGNEQFTQAGNTRFTEHGDGQFTQHGNTQFTEHGNAQFRPFMGDGQAEHDDMEWYSTNDAGIYPDLTHTTHEYGIP